MHSAFYGRQLPPTTLSELPTELLTHSGIYPRGAVKRSPALNQLGEFDDPQISPESLSDYLKIAELSPDAQSARQIGTELFGRQNGAQHDAAIGTHLATYSGFVNDPAARAASSSGGLATALLVELLESGEVNGVIHMRKVPGQAAFAYGISSSIREVQEGAKTRYFPGSLYQALDEVRKKPGRYAVIGIPSFIGELRRLEAAEPELSQRIVYHLGLICGHQKTANYTLNLAWQVGINPTTLIDIDYRYKRPRHSANDYATRFVYTAGSTTCTKIVPQTELFGANWGWGMFKSTFSDLTIDAFNETADIVLGDAWLEPYSDDYRGTNIVIVRDRRLLDTLRRLHSQGAIALAELAPSDVVRSQASLVRHSVEEIAVRRRLMRRMGIPLPALPFDAVPETPVPWARRAVQAARLMITTRTPEAFAKALQAGNWSIFERKMRFWIHLYKAANLFWRVQSKISRQVHRRQHRGDIL